MVSEILWTVLAVIGISFQIIGVVGLIGCYRTMRDIQRQIAAMDDSGTPPATPVLKLPRLSRRMPEPEPGGTKVYPREAWDEGLERTEV